MTPQALLLRLNPQLQPRDLTLAALCIREEAMRELRTVENSELLNILVIFSTRKGRTRTPRLVRNITTKPKAFETFNGTVLENDFRLTVQIKKIVAVVVIGVEQVI